MNSSRLITGYGWKDGRPVLRLRRDEGRGASSVRQVMGRLLLGVGGRRCTGFRQGRQPMPCPDRARPTGRQCVECMSRDTFRPCMICTGFDCPRLVPAALESCLQTHHLYLASFGGQEVKVGTASHHRRTARPVDQGPLFVAIVASGPGPRIKQLESVTSHETEAVEGMRRARKLSLLRGNMSTKEAEDRVMQAFSAMRAAASDYTDLVHTPEPVAIPRLARETREMISAEAELPVEEGCRIEGNVTGAVGHVAVLEDPQARFVLDLGQLVGRLVDLDPPKSVRRSQVQLGLF